MNYIKHPFGAALIGLFLGIGACFSCSFFCIRPTADSHPVKYKVLEPLPGEHSVLKGPIHLIQNYEHNCSEG